MTALTTIELVGCWISLALTICILSFLYEDNPVYKLAEHLFLGVSIAISVVEIYYGVMKPNLIEPLLGGELLSLVPLVLVVMLFFKLHRKLSYLARVPIAFIVAAYAGVKLTGEANANLMTQVAQSMPNLSQLWADHGIWDWSADGAGVFSGIALVLGLSACLLHFYFSAPHKKAMKYVSRFGILTLMLSFGASFGYTVMGRISLAIGRAQEMMGLDKAPAVAEQVHPKTATVLLTIAVIGFLVVWKKRQKTA